MGRIYTGGWSIPIGVIWLAALILAPPNLREAVLVWGSVLGVLALVIINLYKTRDMVGSQPRVGKCVRCGDYFEKHGLFDTLCAPCSKGKPYAERQKKQRYTDGSSTEGNVITVKYAAPCIRCSRMIRQGEIAHWQKDVGIWHENCP